MRKLIKLRPTPSMAVALVALFVALGGVGYAAATIGSAQIKNNSIQSKDIRNKTIRGKDVHKSTLTGKQVKNNSLKGADILESTLGKVPTATAADLAGRALSVDTLKTSGQRKIVTASASDADFATAQTAATEVPLFSVGAFDVYGKCFTTTGGPDTYAYAYIRTRSSGSILDSDGDTLDGDPTFLSPDTPEDSRQMEDADGFANGAAISADDNATFGATAPDGTTISGQASVAAKNGTLPGGDGIYGAGDRCIFWGHAAIG